MVFRAVEQARLGGPGAGVLCAGHGVRAHKPPPERVVLRCVANLALGGAHVHDDLLRDRGLHGGEAVQDIRHQLHGSAHGHGHHHDIGPSDAVLVRDHFVYQADGLGGLRRNGVLLYTQHLAGKAAALEVQRHRPAYQAQADYAYCKM